MPAGLCLRWPLPAGLSDRGRLASVSLHEGTTSARRHRCLSAALIAAVPLVSAITLKALDGEEPPFVRADAALLRHRPVTR